MLQDAGLKAAIVPVTITSGGSARREGGVWHVRRRDLLGKLVVEFEQGGAGGDCGGAGGVGAWERA
jgi:hypothetical protein